jgi:hypothetical protein
MGTFDRRDAVVPTPMGLSLPPFGNRPPIITISVTTLRPVFRAAVVLPLKSFTAVVGNPLKS